MSVKMAYYLYLSNAHKRCLNSNLLKLLVESLILSHLYYALPVWGPPLNYSAVISAFGVIIEPGSAAL